MGRSKAKKREPAQPSDEGRLTLDERLPLRIGLGAAFAGVVGYAAAMVDDCAKDPVHAVHEYRKALRRARAVVRLARPVLGDACYHALVQDLRVALRGTSPLRDAAVLLSTLAGLPDDAETRAARKALARLLEQEDGAPPGAPQVELRRSLHVVSPMPERLVGCLPRRVRWRELRAGLERSYRRTRRACRRAFRSREDAEVHAFRKRVKELRYQLELLEAAGGGRLVRSRRDLATLAENLGAVTDLTLLRRCARLRAEELSKERLEALLAALDGAIADRLSALEQNAQSLFERSPARFAERATRSFH